MANADSKSSVQANNAPFTISIKLDQSGEIREQLSGAFLSSQADTIASHLVLLASRVRNAARVKSS